MRNTGMSEKWVRKSEACLLDLEKDRKVKVKVKVKVTLGQATKAHRGNRAYTFTLSLTSVLDWVGRQLHAPAALPR
jgi:hypothetical protein